MNTTPTNGRNPLKPLLDHASDALASQRGYNPTSTARNGNGHPTPLW